LGKFSDNLKTFSILMIALFEHRKKLLSFRTCKRIVIALFTKSMVFVSLFRRKQGLQTEQQFTLALR